MPNLEFKYYKVDRRAAERKLSLRILDCAAKGVRMRASSQCKPNETGWNCNGTE